MCGIAGIYSPHGRPINPDVIPLMLNHMRHRGPDGQGVFLDSGKTISWTDFRGARYSIPHPWPVHGDRPVVALGHCRLAIIDLTEAGHQPMSDTAKRYWIVFNGECYNYIELREQLTALGYRFHSQTDTEVILSAFQHWQAECFTKFNGMWSIAIWDAKDRELLLCRDRFGVKPLYYTHSHQGAYAFASEAKALMPITTRQANLETLGSYLTFGVVDQHPTQTFFSDIHHLEKGSLLKLRADEESHSTYWQPEVPDASLTPANFGAACAAFMEIFRDSVRLRLRSDVPVGSCLSGGLDSSAIVCQIASIRATQSAERFQQHTVTAHYHNLQADEWPYAEIVGKQIAAAMHKAEASPDDLMSSLEALIWHQDEPFYGLSMYAQWCVFREAKQAGLKVMLDGQGADELLGGYEPWGRYFKDLVYSWQFRQFFHEFRAYQHRIHENPLKILTQTLFRPDGWVRSSYRKILKQEQENQALISQDLQLSGKYFQKKLHRLKSNMWNFLLTQWYTTSLPALLRFEDRNSMAHSIEARLPFLDYRLMRLAFSLHTDDKLRDGWTKAVLREGVKGFVPEEIRLRKIKQGFSTPQKQWLAGEKFTQFARDILGSSQTTQRGWLDSLTFAKSLVSDHFYSSKIGWRILNAEIWARQFIESPVIIPIFADSME